MILGFLIGLVVGAFFGAWLYWNREIKNQRRERDEAGYKGLADWVLREKRLPSDEELRLAPWLNRPYDRLHERRDRL